jgi:Transposase DDE domain
MRHHSRSQDRAGDTGALDQLTVAKAPTSFLDAWNQLVGDDGVPALPRRRGRKPRVPVSQLLPALTFHVMNGAGTLSEHFAQLFAADLADSSWSDRRVRLPWEIFTDVMRRALRPLASRRHPEAFWRGWRLLALDAAQFSLTNTPQVLGALPKARTRRGRAAFAKMTTAVLVELGLHNPVAAAIGRHNESEWALAGGLLAQLPKRALLLGDRLYGCGAFAAEALAACQRVGSHFLLRARMEIKPRVGQRLPDGSRLIQVPVRDKGRRAYRILRWLDLREIRVQVGRPGHRPHELRLWTSLMDPDTAPAQELAALYARRWEHELYYRELKHHLRRTDLLQSHTVDTGAQEIAALVWASALVARERARAAAADVPVLRVSFIKVLQVVQSLWLFFGPFDDLMTDQLKDRIIERGYTLMGTYVTAKRRSRSCPRAVRQPVTGWPRLLRNESVEGPLHLKVL